tara:strand:+ start:3044 stop:3250 length:207 start_codon:yes stop_codon:yes gene_type:complete
MVKSCIKSKTSVNIFKKKVTFAEQKWVGILEVPKNESRLGHWFTDAIRRYDFYKKKWHSFANRLLLQK